MAAQLLLVRLLATVKMARRLFSRVSRAPHLSSLLLLAVAAAQEFNRNRLRALVFLKAREYHHFRLHHATTTGPVIGSNRERN